MARGDSAYFKLLKMIARSKHQFSRIVIFLDFDGVLHSKFSGSFDLMPNFFRVLEEFPCAMVVISSDWREQLTDKDYFQLFGKHHSRIIGITPRIKFARRETEILQYVKNAQISQFIAIDDDCRDELFSYKCPWLFKTDFNNGLDLLATEKLLQFINDKLIKIES